SLRAQAKQSRRRCSAGLLRRCAPRNDDIRNRAGARFRDGRRQQLSLFDHGAGARHRPSSRGGAGAVAAPQIARRREATRHAAAAHELLRGARLVRRGAADAVAENAAHPAGRRQRADHSRGAARAGADRAARHESDPQPAARHRDVPGPRLALRPAAGPLRRAGERDRSLYAHLRDVSRVATTAMPEFKPGTVYVTYIAATPEKVWQALTSSEFTRKYFWDRDIDIEPKLGGAFALKLPDGKINVRGKVIAWDPPRKLAVTWQVEWPEDFRKLPECVVTYETAQAGEGVRLNMTESHSWNVPEAILSGGRTGCPAILSSLKSLLETGH